MLESAASPRRRRARACDPNRHGGRGRRQNSGAARWAVSLHLRLVPAVAEPQPQRRVLRPLRRRRPTGATSTAASASSCGLGLSARAPTPTRRRSPDDAVHDRRRLAAASARSRAWPRSCSASTRPRRSTGTSPEFLVPADAEAAGPGRPRWTCVVNAARGDGDGARRGRAPAGRVRHPLPRRRSAPAGRRARRCSSLLRRLGLTRRLACVGADLLPAGHGRRPICRQSAAVAPNLPKLDNSCAWASSERTPPPRCSGSARTPCAPGSAGSASRSRAARREATGSSISPRSRRCGPPSRRRRTCPRRSRSRASAARARRRRSACAPRFEPLRPRGGRPRPRGEPRACARSSAPSRRCCCPASRPLAADGGDAGPEYSFAWRWATGWLAASMRVAPAATRAEGVLIFDASRADRHGLAARAGARARPAPRRPADADADARARPQPPRRARCTPRAAGGRADRPARVARHARPARLRGAPRRRRRVAVFDFRGALPETGASTVAAPRRPAARRPRPARRIDLERPRGAADARAPLSGRKGRLMSRRFPAVRRAAP